MDFEFNKAVRKNSGIVNGLNIFLFIYSIYKIFTVGFNDEYKFYSYIPLVLSIVAFISLTIYTKNLFRTDISHSNSFSTLIGFIPFFAGCYMFFFLGIYGIYLIVIDFNTLTFIRSIIFTYIGYKFEYHLWLITEIQLNYSESHNIEKD